ncbi:MAG: glycosyltransferase family 39 protein [Deltaproteobacteria bacterium]|jgi:hypothetical protein|nr:glycosyltransferase family 39 protein [Deltaproteobacteria bacterium]MBW2534247.1 glycosyltransferase family 39 protein [Deltaproteobacteria bacterium]
MRLPRLPTPERGPTGLPIVSRLERRLSFGIVLVATVWFGLAAAWEMFGPILAGHYASSASVGIMAENMLRWGIAGPVWEYTAHRPPPSAYYCHHPWGIFWTTAAVMKLLGRHDFVCRLPAVLLSTATPLLLFALGRAIWRPIAGAAAAAAFVVLPIALAFANFNALEVPVMAWSLLGLWGFVRYTQTRRRRHLAASLIGFGLALHADWPAYVLVALLLAFGLVRGFLLPRWPFGRTHTKSYATWWALLATVSVVTFVLYVAIFHGAGKLDDLLASYRLRSAGADVPLWKMLAGRRYWLELSFTPIAIAVGVVAALVCALRLAFRRAEHEVIPLLLLAMAWVQYVHFPQGAEVHVFWPLYFAAFFGLGMGALAATGVGLGDWLLRRHRRDEPAGGAGAVPGRRLGRAPLVSVTAVVLVLCLLILRDGIPVLGYARGTGGRFEEKGLLIHSDGAKTAFLGWLAAQLPLDAVVGMHIGMKHTWAQAWALGGRVVRSNQPPPLPWRRHQVYLLDTRFAYDEVQAKLAAEHRVAAVGPFWKVARGEAAGPIDAYRFAEREPTLSEWYLYSGTEPQRSVVPDPFGTWQLRIHFDQPAAEPTVPPTTLGDRLVAHNVAVDRGDEAARARWWGEIEAALGPPTVDFDDGTRLCGVRYDDGARPTLTMVFRAAGPAAEDLQLYVRSTVLEPAPWSTTMADPTTRQVGLPLGLSPKRWRGGFLYAHRVAIRKRPGTERFEAYFDVRRRPRGSRPPVPRPESGERHVEVLLLR